MKTLLLSLVLCFGFAASAENVDLRSEGKLYVSGQQSLPNENGQLEVVNNNDLAHLSLYAKCSIFNNCKNFTLKIHAPQNIYAIKLSENSYNKIAEMKDPGFTQGHTVPSENGKYVITTSGDTQNLGKTYQGERIPGQCRTESYCAEWVTDNQGHQYCRRWVERHYCDPDRFVCYENTHYQTNTMMKILNASDKSLLVEFMGNVRTDSSRKLAPTQYCHY